jgi:hypothetical protein
VLFTASASWSTPAWSSRLASSPNRSSLAMGVLLDVRYLDILRWTAARVRTTKTGPPPGTAAATRWP